MVCRQSHSWLIVQPRAAALDQWLPPSFVVQRNGSLQIRKRAYLRRGEMGFRVLHPKAAGAGGDSRMVDNGRPYHKDELRGTEKSEELATAEKHLHL